MEPRGEMEPRPIWRGPQGTDDIQRAMGMTEANFRQAIYNSNIDIVSSYISVNGLPERFEGSGTTPLYVAISRAHGLFDRVNEMAVAVSNGDPINMHNFDIIMSTLEKRLEIIDIVLSAGTAEERARRLEHHGLPENNDDYDISQPLMFATHKEEPQIVWHLLKALEKPSPDNANVPDLSLPDKMRIINQIGREDQTAKQYAESENASDKLINIKEIIESSEQLDNDQSRIQYYQQWTAQSDPYIQQFRDEVEQGVAAAEMARRTTLVGDDFAQGSSEEEGRPRARRRTTLVGQLPSPAVVSDSDSDSDDEVD